MCSRLDGYNNLTGKCPILLTTFGKIGIRTGFFHTVELGDPKTHFKFEFSSSETFPHERLCLPNFAALSKIWYTDSLWGKLTTVFLSFCVDLLPYSGIRRLVDVAESQTTSAICIYKISTCVRYLATCLSLG